MFVVQGQEFQTELEAEIQLFVGQPGRGGASLEFKEPNRLFGGG